MTVPLIDLSSSSDIREEIALACREWGAFQAINHGIPIHLLDDMRSAGLGFFESYDLDQKLKYSCDTKVAASEGYGTRMLVSQDDGAVLDWREYFDHHTFPLSRRDPSRWPDSPPNYRYPPRVGECAFNDKNSNFEGICVLRFGSNLIGESDEGA